MPHIKRVGETAVLMSGRDAVQSVRLTDVADVMEFEDVLERARYGKAANQLRAMAANFWEGMVYEYTT